MAPETTTSHVLLDEFIHVWAQDDPDTCLAYLAGLHNIVIEGPVEVKNPELFLTLVELLGQDYADEGQTLKRIVDVLCLVVASWKDNRALIIPEMRQDDIIQQFLLFHIEHQHRNDYKMPWRLYVYLGMLGLKYPENKILQLLIYTGDAPFSSNLPHYGGTGAMVPLLIDLTQIDPQKVMNHPSIHIRILIIFNHRIDAATKAAFLLKELEELYAKAGKKQLNYYFSLIIRGKTMQNRDAITMLEEQLANSPHIHNELLDNPFYIRWTEKGKAEGKAEGEATGEARGKLNSALNLMGNMGVDAERAADLLGFSSEERAALFEHIAQMTDANIGKAQA
jgi:hypothetical protein